jgi:uncharacterized protein
MIRSIAVLLAFAFTSPVQAQPMTPSPSAAQSIAAPVNEASVRARNVEVIKQFYQTLEAKDVDAFVALFGEDGVQDMPYSPPGHPRRVETRTEIARLYAGFPNATNAVRFPNLRIYQSDDPNRMFVEVDGYVEFKGAAQPYRQSYMNIFEFRDGQIQLFREYYNPIPFAEAIGIGRYEVINRPSQFGSR